MNEKLILLIEKDSNDILSELLYCNALRMKKQRYADYVIRRISLISFKEKYKDLGVNCTSLPFLVVLENNKILEFYKGFQYINLKASLNS